MNSLDPFSFLRASLRGNAAFSILSGLCFSLASRPIATFLGEVPPALVLSVGIQLLLFAGFLVWLSTRAVISIPLAITVVSADVVWVLGTVVVVYADVLSRGGAIAAMLVANIVLLFAVLQGMGIQRVRGPKELARS